MELYANAKLNVTLDVLGRRTDGYHELRSLMLPVDLCDRLTVTPQDTLDVSFSGMAADALASGDTTLHKAAAAYGRLAGRSVGARVQVHKRIPVQAGLGGGSADAAAMLRALQALYGLLDPAQLREAALIVGADVPFCMQGGLCEASGIGERLRPLRLGAPLHVVIAKPEEGVSTKALFESLTLPLQHPDTDGAVKALERGDVHAIAPLLYNAMEPAALRLCPEIAAVKARLLQEGALAAVMTGSGSAVFGLFECAADAKAAAGRMADVPFAAAAQAVV